MKLDDTAKIVSMLSIIVGLMISGAGFFANRQLQKVQAAVADVDAKAKALQMASQEMDNAASSSLCWPACRAAPRFSARCWCRWRSRGPIASPKKHQSAPILRSHAATLRTALIGSEIGSLRDDCRRPA